MLEKIFIAIYQFFEKKRTLLFSILALIVIVCIALLSRLSFEEDISSFLPNNKENQRINYAYQHIANANTIIISIKGSKQYDYEQITENIATELSTLLEQNDTCKRLNKILCEINTQDMLQVIDFIIENMPLYLTEADYQRMDSLLSFEYINQQLAENKYLLSAPTPIFREILMHDPLHFCSPALEGLANFKVGNEYEIKDNFIFRNTDSATIILLSPAFSMTETANNKLLANDINNAINTISEQYTNVQISAFGAPLISVENAQQIKKDSLLAVTIALIFILIILCYYFRNIRSLLLIIVSIGFGVLFAIGIIALINNEISLIAIGVSSIIIGIAINYPLHFLSHARHVDNTYQLIADIVNPLLIGNLTTIGAFLSLLFISSPAMKDMGLLAALLLLGTILFVLLFLPHCIKKEKIQNTSKNNLIFNKISNIQIENHKYIVAIVLLLTIVLYFFSLQTEFDDNMHNINYMTKEQRHTLNQILSNQDTTIDNLYLVSDGNNIDEALMAYEHTIPLMTALQKQDKILSFSGIGNYIPSQQQQQAAIERWNCYWKDKQKTFLDNLDKAAEINAYNNVAFNKFKQIIKRDYQVHDFTYFAVLSNNLAQNYLSIEEDKSLVYCLIQIPKSHRTEITKVFENKDNVFLFDNSSILNRMINTLSDDFNKVLYICAFIVFAFLLYSFGSLELSLISFVPLMVAWIWILGLMGIFGLKFNIVNIILATFIFGQGDDYTIFVTEGLMYEYRYGKPMLAKFKSAIMLSSLIMFIGIGTLIFAQHPAMKSLAEVTIVGMLSVVLMAYLFPPLLFKTLTYKNKKPRKYPLTLKDILRSIYVYTNIFIVILVVHIVGFVLLSLGGKTKKHQQQYHLLLHHVFRSILRFAPNNGYVVHNRELLQDKPKIIIANHQSIVDIVAVLALSPNIVIVVNDWVWNSFWIGKIIRYAGFMKIDQDLLFNTDQIEERLRNGYSVVIFPEATRSVDCTIGNFHKGAFYLAQQLNLDIQPIILHGTGHIVPKNTYIIRKGKIDVKILPIIPSATSPLFDHNKLLQTAKNYKKYMVEQYQLFCRETEDTQYWQKTVLHNYLYKGREVYIQAKRTMKKHDNFQKIVDLLPNNGSCLLMNCQQGEISLISALCRPSLTIYAFDKQENNLLTAKNCAANPQNLIYENYKAIEKSYDTIVACYPSQEQIDWLYLHQQSDNIYILSDNKENFSHTQLITETPKYKILQLLSK